MDVSKKKFAIVFRCPVPKCSYTSKRLYNLQRHEKTHGREHWRSKRFPCPCCAYAAATRPHLKRHMGNKHPFEDISKYDLVGLAYEDLETPSADSEEKPALEIKKEQEEEEEQREEAQRESRRNAPAKKVPDGPVTVLQLVTPESKALPGERYCRVSLEGEAFRLIPVAFLPPEAAVEEL